MKHHCMQNEQQLKKTFAVNIRAAQHGQMCDNNIFFIFSKSYDSDIYHNMHLLWMGKEMLFTSLLDLENECRELFVFSFHN